MICDCLEVEEGWRLEIEGEWRLLDLNSMVQKNSCVETTSNTWLLGRQTKGLFGWAMAVKKAGVGCKL